MKNPLLKLLISFAIIAYCQLSFAAFEYRDHLIASLLISDDPMELKVGGKLLEEEASPKVELTDLAAKRLLMNHENTVGENIDANAWLIRGLKQSKNKRYLTLLKTISATTTNEKIKRYTDSAIPALTKGNDNTFFESDNYDFKSISEEIMKNTPTTQFSYNHIDSVVKGENSEAIYKRLGYPNDVSYYIHSKWMPFVGKVRLQDALLIYKGSGSIRLLNRGGQQIVSVVIPEKAPIIAKDISQTLSNANGVRTAILAKTLYKNKDYSQELLDLAANKIWKEKENTNGQMVDGVAWLCKYLGQSKNSRYYTLLDRLINSSENKKIIKHAKRSIKMIPNTALAVDSFSPES